MKPLKTIGDVIVLFTLGPDRSLRRLRLPPACVWPRVDEFRSVGILFALAAELAGEDKNQVVLAMFGASDRDSTDEEDLVVLADVLIKLDAVEAFFDHVRNRGRKRGHRRVLAALAAKGVAVPNDLRSRRGERS